MGPEWGGGRPRAQKLCGSYAEVMRKRWFWAHVGFLNLAGLAGGPASELACGPRSERAGGRDILFAAPQPAVIHERLVHV